MSNKTNPLDGFPEHDPATLSDDSILHMPEPDTYRMSVQVTCEPILGAFTSFVFSMPEDPAFLRAVGTVAIRHAHLDYTMRMTVKTLTGMPIATALEETEFEGAKRLRGRVRKAALDALGDGPALACLDALLEQCRLASERRNSIMHGIVCEADGMIHQRGLEGPRSLPSVDDLTALAKEIERLYLELNLARKNGFIAEAMRRTAAGRLTGQ